MSRGGFRGRGRPIALAQGRDALVKGLSAGDRKDWEAVRREKGKYGGEMYPPLDDADVAYLPEPTDFELSILEHAEKQGESSTAWKIPTERKHVGIEIESYSDRSQPPPKSTFHLDPTLLHMDESMFPPGLWKGYFADTKLEGSRAGRKRGRDPDEEMPNTPEELSDPESDTDFSFDEDEDEPAGDYDHNYFDNGEGDDDSGRGEDDEGGGGHDD